MHQRTVADPSEAALGRALALPAAPDSIVRALFRLRGIRGGELPLERFAPEVLGLELVERTPTTAAFVGRWRRLQIGLSLEADGPRLVTETRVAALDRRALRAFRVYWLVVRPFSGLIRRRWLRAAAAAPARATPPPRPPRAG